MSDHMPDATSFQIGALLISEGEGTATDMLYSKASEAEQILLSSVSSDVDPAKEWLSVRSGEVEHSESSDSSPNIKITHSRKKKFSRRKLNYDSANYSDPGSDRSLYSGATFMEGMRSETLALYEKRDIYDLVSWVEKKPEDFDDRERFTTDKQSQYAILVRNRKATRKYATKAYEVDSILVHSPLIKEVLTEVFSGYPGLTTTLRELTFQSPFREFVHRWDDFKSAVEKQTDETCKAHLQLLYDAIHEEIQSTLDEAQDLIKNNVITYDLLYVMFKPGALVYTKLGEMCIFEKDIDGDGRNLYELHMIHLDWDGKVLGWASHTTNISRFEGTRAITELAAYPFQYANDQASIKDNLLRLGRKFMGLRGIHHKAASSEGLNTIHDRSRASHAGQSEQRIIIDAEAYYKHMYIPKPLLNPLEYDAETGLAAVELPTVGVAEIIDVDVLLAKPTYTTHEPEPRQSRRKNRRRTRSPSTQPAKILEKKPEVPDIKLTDEQLMLCKHTVFGFSIKSRKWSTHHVDSIREVVFNDAALDNLVLPTTHKDLVLGFVDSQISEEKNPGFDDFVEGKGRGLIFLLSGPPGVGKTFTVEAIAERLHAPLYPFSAVELGHDVAAVEKSFEEMLDTAARWGAVLLLDEADVFLVQRTVQDLQRNRLVSVFLRLLEYFEGVLFLTTNRASEMDDAFESRIDLHLEYPQLDSESREAVWRNFLAKCSCEVDITADEIYQISRIPLNGRQIKSVVKQAQLLASAKKGTVLRFEHLEIVLSMFKGRLVKQ